jgi:glycogen debranching enzyme
MSTRLSIPADELIEIASPFEELPQMEPRRANILTLIDGKTFLCTTVAGDITPPGAPDVGFFHDDTRFLSHLELKVSGHRAAVLSSSTENNFAAQIELTTGKITRWDDIDVPENTIHIRREQLLGGDVFFDCFAFENFNLSPVPLQVELCCNADFADVFQVRGSRRDQQGQYYQPVARDGLLIFHYRGLDGVMRRTSIELKPAPARIVERTAYWDLDLPPLRRFEIEVKVRPFVGADAEEDQGRQPHFDETLRQRRRAYNEWRSQSTTLRSSHGLFDAVVNTGIGDFHALQVPDRDQHIIAAGIPWFATIFGRDSLIAAFQSLLVNPGLARDTLRVLSRYQGREHSDWRDEEPGKILHELRDGEMTRCGEVPFSPYYGSIDSTPLFLILLSETYNWTADDELVRELLPAAYRALDWIEQYGDLDHDGLVEYIRRSPRGLINQGWKDSWDANMHVDGTVARPPIALIEVQGYVYDAKYRMASLLRSFGDPARAEKLKREAVDLARRVDRTYWMPGRGYYAMALDGAKQQLQVISSNPGHLLFTRILNRERARAVVNRLMRDDMFTGWGWRTLSQGEKVFNPLSYHRGSVWPHDNSLIAHGMALNEFRRPALQIMTALFQAALNFREYRLPELFCGVQRRESDEPVHYPVSCSPQAWASGAMFLILTSILGIRPSAPRKELNVVNPELPEWLEFLHIRNLQIGQSRVGLDFTRHGHRTFCNVVDVEGERLLVNVAFKR